jgi:hypothetical protein
MRSFTSSASKIDSFVDHISQNEQKDINIKMAKMIYVNNLAFNIVENKEFKELFRAIRPSLRIPSRYEISSPLLENEYKKVMTASKALIDSSNSLTILIDGWSNIRNDGIVNIIICTPKPIFYKSIPTETNSHTGEYMLKLVEIPIKEFGINKITALISDNGPDVKCMRKLLSNAYPSIISFGCAAHGLNLLLGDICKIKSINTALTRCKEIVKEVKLNYTKSAKFREYSDNRNMLQLSVATRWYSVVNMLESVIKGRNVLVRMACEESEVCIKDSNNVSAIKENRYPFWSKIETIKDLLKSITDGIAIVESDKSSIADVSEVWFAIKQKLNIETAKVVSSNEQKNIQNFITKREEIILTPNHFTANLLHPKFKGKNLSDKEHESALEIINNFCINSNVEFNTYMEFSTKEGKFKAVSLWSETCTANPIIWWKYFLVFEKTKEFANFAVKLLSIPPTTASVERGFSHQARIHVKDRNKLLNTKVEKLLAIQLNSKYIEEETHHNLYAIEENDLESYEIINETEDTDYSPEIEFNFEELLSDNDL